MAIQNAPIEDSVHTARYECALEKLNLARIDILL